MNAPGRLAGPELARLPASRLRELVLEGVRAGHPLLGPQEVHLDLTNTCNARCISCWDHSPLLRRRHPPDWFRHQLDYGRFEALLAELDALGSVRRVVVSGRGEPLLHPRVHDVLEALAARPHWKTTLISNLVAAEPERLARIRIDQLLLGLHAARPETYAAFHPGWGEEEFFRALRAARRLRRAGVRLRVVQVIVRQNAAELVEMARLGAVLRAERVNYKLASLGNGTEAIAATDEQLRWMLAEGIPRAREEARRRGVGTNLGLFERQVRAALEHRLATTPPQACFMGYVYTRITAEGELHFCCELATLVGRLGEAPLAEQWWGERWQALRDRLARGEFFPGCARCGKFEQNQRWAARLRGERP